MGETDKPIIFSGPMVRAILAGRKSQTRRIINVGKYAEWLEGYSSTGKLANYNGDHRLGLQFASDEHGLWNPETNPNGRSSWCVPVPYHPGMLLWVREAWAPLSALKHNDPGTTAIIERGFYRADQSVHDDEITRWRPSIHMPRWASRLSLEVTAVKVERLQDISEEDAKAEGTAKWYEVGPFNGNEAMTFKAGFCKLWGSINGPASWDANPWVVAITFKTHRKNVDQFRPHPPPIEPGE
jgi:hypothetical protein